MKPGRELDALIAERVMDWLGVIGDKQHQISIDGENWTVGFKSQIHDYHRTVEVPHYSTDIAEAWTVVEKLRTIQDGRYYEYSLQLLQMGGTGTYYRCSFMYVPGEPTFGGRANAAEVTGETAPHAICLAALKALET